MSFVKFKVEDLETGEEFIEDDFYWFEEEGVKTVNTDGLAHGFYRDYKITFIDAPKEGGD